jgi:hypothetical protein
LDAARYPDIHYLGIDRPALLRPDAVRAALSLRSSARGLMTLQHAAGDCLHIMSGAGVLEGWSHYIWHFVTRELPGRLR